MVRHRFEIRDDHKEPYSSQEKAKYFSRAWNRGFSKNDGWISRVAFASRIPCTRLTHDFRLWRNRPIAQPILMRLDQWRNRSPTFAWTLTPLISTNPRVNNNPITHRVTPMEIRNVTFKIKKLITTFIACLWLSKFDFSTNIYLKPNLYENLVNWKLGFQNFYSE